MEIEELERYLWVKLKALGLSGKPLAGEDYPCSWLYEGRRVTITRRKQKWLGFHLDGRWHIFDKKGVDHYIEEHV